MVSWAVSEEDPVAGEISGTIVLEGHMEGAGGTARGCCSVFLSGSCRDGWRQELAQVGITCSRPSSWAQMMARLLLWMMMEREREFSICEPLESLLSLLNVRDKVPGLGRQMPLESLKHAPEKLS